ncbi:MAG: hypothetical protein IPN71_14365 [Fibrobacteres bacterium]|nr:hypothetical protein [Fibrobacterota bacterium]
MSTLLLRFLLAPALVGVASLCARHWGNTVGGWIAALPFVAGPLLLVVTLEQGHAFAAGSARSALSGIVALAVFSNVYARLCLKWPWWAALPGGWLAYLASAWAMSPWDLGVVARLVGALVSLWLARALLPSVPEPREASTAPSRPSWDLAARMGSAAALVGTIATLAQRMGPNWSGLLAPFPISTTILVAFTQAQEGPVAVTRMLRGFLPALTGLTFFFATLAFLLPLLPTFQAFAIGLAITAATQALAIRIAGK